MSWRASNVKLLMNRLVESDGVWCHCGLKSTVTKTALFYCEQRLLAQQERKAHKHIKRQPLIHNTRQSHGLGHGAR